MPKSPLVRRDVETRDTALAKRLEALGLDDEVLREAVETHKTAMRDAALKDGRPDHPTRQRSADALLGLARLAGSGHSDGGRAPLVELHLTQAPPMPRADIIDAEAAEG
jgi:hypothetical protein